MIILEDYKNLNRIDISILKDIDFKENRFISPNSEIEINKVKEPHSFTHVIDILNDESVGGIVFRASRRQLLAIIKHGSDDNYKIIFSEYIMQKVPTIENRYSKVVTASSDSYLRTVISTVFQSAYGDDETIKRVWDILVIKKDSNDDLRNERYTRKRGIIPLEKEDKVMYDNYLNSLKSKLNYDLEKYKESKMPNLKSKEDFMNYLINNERLRKIKLKDTIYSLYEEKTMSHGKEFIYRKSNDGEFPFEYIFLKVSYNGLYPEISDIFGSNSRYSSEYNNALSYLK